MWMKRYGWDAICRDSDGEGSGGGSAENDIEAQAFGISTGIGNPEAEPEDFDDTSDFGTDPNAEPDDFDNVEAEVDFSLDPSFGLFDPAFDPEEEDDENEDKSLINQTNVVDLGLGLVGIPSRGMRGLAGFLGPSIDKGLSALGLEGEAPEQGPSTGAGSTGEVDFGDSGNFGGVGGGQTGAGDGADTARQPPLAGSVRPPRRNDVSGPGVSRSPAPAPPLDLPSSDIDEIRAELDAEREARRRRRRATRQSTIVTGPLGVMGRPELLRPTAIAGASRRLLGQ